MKRQVFGVIALFVIALWWRLFPGIHSIIFPYDQARDVLMSREMIRTHHVPILGPISDIPGVHHGPLFYWLIAPLYAFGRYNPRIVVIVLSVLSALGVVTTFIAMRSIFDEQVAWFASVLYLASYMVVGASRWISNPSLVIPVMPLFLLAAYRWFILGKRSMWVGLLFGILVQLELVLLYLGILLAVLMFGSKQKVVSFGGIALGFIVGALPLFVAEFKFHFQATKSLFEALFSSHGQTHFRELTILQDIGVRVGLLMRDTLFAVSPVVAVLFFVLILLWLGRRWRGIRKSERFGLLLMFGVLLSSFALFFTGRQSTNFFFFGVECSIFALGGYWLANLWKAKRKIVAVGTLVFLVILQFRLYTSEIHAGHAYVQVQQGVLLSERLEVVDAIYKETQGQPFTLSVFGTPYGIRTAWAYYLWLYQQTHMVVLPHWYGFAANGYIGDDMLSTTDAPGSIHIVVYEPSFAVGPDAFESFAKYQDEHTTLVREFMLNNHRIQVRTPIMVTTPPRTPSQKR